MTKLKIKKLTMTEKEIKKLIQLAKREISAWQRFLKMLEKNYGGKAKN